MRQILGSSSGAILARVPKPAVEAGAVLVQTHYSMVSSGTELAGLQPIIHSDETAVEKAKTVSTLMARYLGKAATDPARAIERLKFILKNKIVIPKELEPIEPIVVDDLEWSKQAAHELDITAGKIELVTDDSPAQYQIYTSPFAVPEGYHPSVTFTGEIFEGAVSIGFLNETQDQWLGASTFSEGKLDDRVVVDSKGSNHSVLVISNAGYEGASRLTLRDICVKLVPGDKTGLPVSETGDLGWNLGYSLSGEVIAVGEGVTDLVPGDLVACSGAGQANHAEYVLIKRNNVCKLPGGCDLRDACSATIGTIAIQGVRRAQPELCDRVLVLGLGLIGLITIRLLKLTGCEVIGFDPLAERVERAKAFGLTCGTSKTSELEKLIRNTTHGHGADKTIITAATKSSKVVNDAMKYTRRKGRVVISGDVGLDLERADFYKKEIDLLMSSSYGPGRYDRSYEELGIDYPYAYVRWTSNRNMEAYLELLASGALDIEPLIDGEYALSDASQAYQDLLVKSEVRPLGVILRYPTAERQSMKAGEAALPLKNGNGALLRNGNDFGQKHVAHDLETQITIRGHRKPRSERVNFALVGAGAFGQSTLVPNLEKSGDTFFLKGVVTRDAVRGGNFARMKNAEILASDLKPILSEKDIDLLVIATRHNEHANQTIAGLKAGKHVFVEKPLAINWQELGEIEEAYNSLDPAPLLMVGFNRRFAPAVQALREAIGNRKAPVMMSYRLNGGYIPKESWIQNEQGAGRNIGEACHIYDLFRSLASSPVSAISATAIDPLETPYLRNDNFVATIRYKDGSVGTLAYTAMGPKKGMTKERFEIFCDGEAYIVDDFKTLTRAGDNTVLWKSDHADKGHLQEMKALATALRNGKAAPIAFSELMETSAVALRVEDLINGRP